MTVKIYGLKTCESCRKAARALPGAVVVDIRAEGLPQTVRDRAWAAFGEALLNTRSTTWRGLGDTERARPPLELLADYPALMKRPLIETGQGDLHLGWTRRVQAALGVG